MATHDEPAATGTVRRRDYRPGGTDAGTGLFTTLKRTALEFSEDKMTIWAAALTYYGLLSLFPALIALVSLLGLFGDPQKTTQTLTDVVTQLGPASAADTFKGPIESVTSSRGSAGIVFFAGLAGALWAASGYVGAFMRTANVVWDVEEGRPIWKTLPLRVGVTLLAIVLLAASAIAVVMTGGLAERAGRLLGLGSTAVTIWDIAKWPVLVLIASSLFALYVAKFGSYNKTYGSLGAIVIFLVWLWLSNLAILVGAELNAELARGRSIAAGAPDDREPYLPPRAEPDGS